MEQNTNTGMPMTPTVDNKQKSGNGLKIATAIACVVAACGIGFGVYGIMQSSQKDNQISNPETQLDINIDESTTINQDDESDSINYDNLFVVNQMGIGIKNLDEAGTITQYKYTRVHSAYPGDYPISLIEILSFDGAPEVGTDHITGISGAIIYEYDEESFFDTSKCTVQLGKINENSLCVARRPIDEEYNQLDTEIFNAWNTWAESNIDKLMTILSNPANYTKIQVANLNIHGISKQK